MTAGSLTVEVADIPEGYEFRRSDGKMFCLIGNGESGNATLFRGTYATARPSSEIVGLTYTIADKIGVARTWILAYPDDPTRCKDCSGKGKFYELQDNIAAPFYPEHVTKPCPRCKGTGYIPFPGATPP
jgi:hypothetical protein